MKIALKITSNKHIEAFKIPGVIILPQHCKREEQSPFNCENGSANAKTKKYTLASFLMALLPFNQTGRGELISIPKPQRKREMQRAEIKAWRITLRALLYCFAPIW